MLCRPAETEDELAALPALCLLASAAVLAYGERGVDAPDVLPFAGAKLVCTSCAKCDDW